jgi:hypothetical protein
MCDIWLCTARMEFQLCAVYLTTTENRLADCHVQWCLQEAISAVDHLGSYIMYSRSVSSPKCVTFSDEFQVWLFFPQENHK